MPWQQYVVSLYWTVTTMTTVGWGDITPQSVPEVAFTLLVLLQGGATFSYMVGNMASLISRCEAAMSRTCGAVCLRLRCALATRLRRRA
eukprot:3786058-Rhodomonas_salina.3